MEILFANASNMLFFYSRDVFMKTLPNYGGDETRSAALSVNGFLTSC